MLIRPSVHGISLLLVFLVACSTVVRAGETGDLEFYNGFDPDKPTVIAVHGLFKTITFDDTFGRSPFYTTKANVIGWEWDAQLVGNFVPAARRSGQDMALDFVLFLGNYFPDYDRPVQLVGHSLGAHVVVSAAQELRELALENDFPVVPQPAQVTFVDPGFNPDLQRAIDDVFDNALAPLKMDNYWSPGLSGGIGTPHDGPLSNIRVPLSHMQTWSWYFTTLDAPARTSIRPGGPYSIVGPLAGVNAAGIDFNMISGRNTPLKTSDDVFAVGR